MHYLHDLLATTLQLCEHFGLYRKRAQQLYRRITALSNCGDLIDPRGAKQHCLGDGMRERHLNGEGRLHLVSRICALDHCQYQQTPHARHSGPEKIRLELARGRIVVEFVLRADFSVFQQRQFPEPGVAISCSMAVFSPAARLNRQATVFTQHPCDYCLKPELRPPSALPALLRSEQLRFQRRGERDLAAYGHRCLSIADWRARAKLPSWPASLLTTRPPIRSCAATCAALHREGWRASQL